MNTFYGLHNFCFLDATTIAIMVPVMTSVVLILAAALHKRYWALQPTTRSIEVVGVEHQNSDDGRIAFAIKRLDLYLYGLVLANFQAAIFLSKISYVILPGEHFGSFLFRYLNPMIFVVVVSILDVVPFLALVQAIRSKKGQFISEIGPGRPARVVFSCMVFVSLALWTVPFTQALFVLFGVRPGYLDLLKDVARVCIGFSTIPLAIMGMILAFTSKSSFGSTFANARAKQRIHLQSLSPETLAALPEDRLHQIVDDARLAQNVEAAEIVSLHLLERAEASMKSS